jgi:hypothetical protein
MKCRGIVSERHTYWNIKGWGHFVVFICGNCLSFRLLAEGRLEDFVAPLWYRSER